MRLDMTKLEPLLGMMVNELGAAANAALVLTGDKLGFYKALAGSDPVTPAELAEKTGTHERYVREWLSAQAASGFVTYDAGSGRFTLSPEQAAVLADDDSPV
jgi:predicted transcriptional regulator